MSRLIDDVSHAWAGEIVKYDENDDGTLDVYGAATSPALDVDEQVCDATWLKRAMPEWFTTAGNIREMHTGIAAGVATEYTADDDTHFIKAHVVDPGSVAKVKAKVLKGFSVGIKKPRVVTDKSASGGRIIDGSIIEVSLVDRPANPDCYLTVGKSADGHVVPVDESLQWRAKGLVADLLKDDAGGIDKPGHAQHDPDFAAAWVAIARLIKQEAKEMEVLGEDELDDIDALLSAMYQLRRFAAQEAREGENVTSQVPNGEQLITNGSTFMGADADLTKDTDTEEANAEVDEASVDEAVETSTDGDADEDAMAPEGDDESADDETDDETDDAEKSVAVDPFEAAVKRLEKAAKRAEKAAKKAEEAVTAAEELRKSTTADLTKARNATEDRLAAVESDLEAVKGLAAPGQPVRVGKTAMNPKQIESDRLRGEAVDLRKRAAAVRNSDRVLADGFLAMADDADKAANAALTK